MTIAAKPRIDPDATSYTNYSQEHEYSHDLGLVVLPIASRVSKHRVIRLHGGFALRKVAWQATRNAAPPVIPAATDTLGDTLLSSSVTPMLPVPNYDKSTYDWAISGVYTYVQNVPRIAGQNALPTGSYPYLLDPQNKLASAYVGQYVPGIVNSAPANITDAITEQAVATATISPAGFVSWPFTALPAAASTTHTIGG